MKVEIRPVPVEELADFDETGACGTAAVITPIHKIVDLANSVTYSYGDGQNAGPVTTKLYENLTGIQNGDIEDTFGWTKILE